MLNLTPDNIVSTVAKDALVMQDVLIEEVLEASQEAKRVPRLPEQVVLSMDLTDTQITETADLYEISLHLPKASTAPQQQQVLALVALE
ncbi:TPA: hypothetical protein ACH3X1_016453 [Trebouxia sp. C0004]